MTSRQEVYAVIDEEREYQERNERTKLGKGYENPGRFLDLMQQYLKSVYGTSFEPSRREETLHVIRKITALGVACMEINGAPRRVQMR